MKKRFGKFSILVPILSGALIALASCSSSTPPTGGSALSNQAPGNLTGQSPAALYPASGKIDAKEQAKQAAAAPPTATVKIAFEMGRAEEQGLDAYKGEFKPQVIPVAVGTTVTWVNDDSFLHNSHTVTSRDGLFDKTLNLGESFNYTFTTPGVYKYYCKIFDIMTGEIDVQ